MVVVGMPVAWGPLAERQALGLPGTQALTLSAGDLKRLVAEFAP